MSDDNEDNPAMSDRNSPHATSGDDNAENVAPGGTSTEDVSSPLLYSRKTTDPSKVKTSRKCRPVRVKPLESSMGDPPADNKATGKVNVMHFLLMCKYMNSLFKAHQTLKI